jgi:hypothetical protein
MRCFLCSAAVIVGVIVGGFARAATLPLAGLSGQKADTGLIREAGWRRKLRRYSYPVPYYPPVYGYYVPPPPAYAYGPPVGAEAVPPAPPVEAYPSAEADYGDYPPANGEYGDYPPGDGY